MSALSIDAAFDHDVAVPSRADLRVVPAATRTRVPEHVRLTRRGRTLITLVFLGGLLAAMLTLGGWATASLTSGTPEPVRVIEVHPGQTLYDIAGEVAKPGHVRQMVDRIQQLNSLPSSGLTAGQKLAIPKD